MSMDASASLVFGIKMSEYADENTFMELPFVQDGDEDLDDVILRDANFTDGLFEEQRKIIDASPVNLEMFGTYDYTGYMLTIPSYTQGADMWEPEAINLLDLVVPQAEIDAFKKWCEEHNVEVQEPKWHLIAFYG